MGSGGAEVLSTHSSQETEEHATSDPKKTSPEWNVIVLIVSLMDLGYQPPRMDYLG